MSEITSKWRIQRLARRLVEIGEGAVHKLEILVDRVHFGAHYTLSLCTCGSEDYAGNPMEHGLLSL